MSSYGLVDIYVYTVSLYYYIIIPIINHTQYTIRNNEITARLIVDRLRTKCSDHSKIDDTFEQLFIIISRAILISCTFFFTNVRNTWMKGNQVFKHSAKHK